MKGIAKFNREKKSPISLNTAVIRNKTSVCFNNKTQYPKRVITAQKAITSVAEQFEVIPPWQ